MNHYRINNTLVIASTKSRAMSAVHYAYDAGYSQYKAEVISRCLPRPNLLAQLREHTLILTEELGIPLSIAFAALGNCVGKYIAESDGTVLVDIVQIHTFSESMESYGVPLEEHIRVTINHEAIHAYLEANGKPCAFYHHNEHRVERLARWCENQGPEGLKQKIDNEKYLTRLR